MSVKAEEWWCLVVTDQLLPTQCCIKRFLYCPAAAFHVEEDWNCCKRPYADLNWLVSVSVSIKKDVRLREERRIRRRFEVGVIMQPSKLPSKDPRTRFHGCQFAPQQTNLTKKKRKWRVVGGGGVTLNSIEVEASAPAFFGTATVSCTRRAQQRLSFHLIFTSVQLAAC